MNRFREQPDWRSYKRDILRPTREWLCVPDGADRDTQSVIRITLPPEFEDRAKVKELVDQLMGRNPEHRFNFIQNNAGDMDREMIDA